MAGAEANRVAMAVFHGRCLQKCDFLIYPDSKLFLDFPGHVVKNQPGTRRYAYRRSGRQFRRKQDVLKRLPKLSLLARFGESLLAVFLRGESQRAGTESMHNQHLAIHGQTIRKFHQRIVTHKVPL